MKFNSVKKILFFSLCFLINISSYSQNHDDNYYDQLSKCALELTYKKTFYDSNYYKIDYPDGDVPSYLGVCSDVIIRAYRKMGVDLQQEIHEDMKNNFSLYPNNWGLKKPDPNIDHRRVPNLMVFFKKFGEELKITYNYDDYQPGDIVCWDLGAKVTHIGLVVNDKNIVHNIGNGQLVSNVLFDYEIIGHYRYRK